MFSLQKLFSQKNILFEDDVIIAINKPANLLVIPDRWDLTKPNLMTILKKHYNDTKIYIVHRLDMDTSGIVLFAKTAEAHKLLNQQMATRLVTKEYLAIVKGVVEQNGSIDLAIDSDQNRKGRMIIRKNGKESKTDYQIIERFKGFTYLKVIPRTGRTHQIRVHLQAIGHPLAIDPLYGNSQPIYLSKFKRNYHLKIDEEERPLINRLTLHAAEISFNHPITGELMQIAAQLPKDMRALLNMLGKYQALPKSDEIAGNF